MKEYTIYPLTVGANETDQGIMTYQRYYGKRIWIPIYVFYIAGGGKNILVDTGLEEFMAEERRLRRMEQYAARRSDRRQRRR
jgi:hypothetical protein